MTVRWGRHLLVGLAVVVGAATVPISPAAAGEQIKGGGSTFAKLAIDSWASDARRALGVDINYQSLGSTAGRNNFASGQYDWASSDVSYGARDTQPTRGFTYTPLVAGGTALAFQLKDSIGTPITDLQLTGSTIAKLFFGSVAERGYWDDPEIVSENPQLAGRLPHTEVKPVTRTTGSGTTAVFTNYLAEVAPDRWGAFSGRFASEMTNNGYTSDWPKGDQSYSWYQFDSNDTVAAAIAESTPAADGRVGYVEYGYAKFQNLPVIRVQNSAGRWTLPTARAVAIALLGATRNADGTQNLTDVFRYPDPEAYAISSYNYAILPTDGTDLSLSKSTDLAKFIQFCITQGQFKAEPLGYSPLPPNLIQQGLDAVAALPGAPPSPDITPFANIYLSLGIDPDTKRVDPNPSGGDAVSGGTAPGSRASAGPGSQAATESAAAATAGTGQANGSRQAALAVGGAKNLTDDQLTARSDAPTWPLVIAGVALVGAMLGPPIIANSVIGPRRRRRSARAAPPLRPG